MPNPLIFKYLQDKGLLPAPPANMSVDNGQVMTPGPSSPPMSMDPSIYNNTPQVDDYTQPSDTPADVPKLPSSPVKMTPSTYSRPKAHAPLDPADSQIDSDEMKRYGIMSPEEIQGLKDKRMQMAADQQKQIKMAGLTQGLLAAGDQIGTSAASILTHTSPDSSRQQAQVMDQVKQGQEGIKAFDDSNEKLGNDQYNRLKDLDMKRASMAQTAQTAADRADALSLNREALRFQKDQLHKDSEDRKDDDQLRKFEKDLNGASASSRSALGRSAQTIQAARSVMALAGNDPKQYDKLSPQQVYELARSYDRVVSNGNPTVSGTSHLIPKSATGSFANFSQWVTSSPQGANLGAVVKQMVDGSKREAAVSQKLQDNMVAALSPTVANLRKRRSGDVESIIQGVSGLQSGDPSQVVKDAGLNNFGQDSQPAQSDTRVVNGHTYERTAGGWKLVK